MNKIGDGDQRPGVEASDLNDGEIISATRKLSDDGGKTISFAYTLPNGQELKSEPVQADLVGKAIFGWLDAVKASIVEISQPVVDEEALERKLREQRDRDFATPGIQPVAGVKQSDLNAVVAGGRIPGTAPIREDYIDATGQAGGPAPLPADAKGYVRAKLAEAKAVVAMLSTQIKQRQVALRKAEQAVEEFQTALKALTAPKGRKAKR